MAHLDSGTAGLRNTLTLKDRFAYAVRRGRGIHLETDLEPYTARLGRVKSYDFSGLTEGDIGRKAVEAAGRVRAGETTAIPEAFATVREACRRALRIDPYDVQLLAGIVLSEGKLAQMKTGEGKTLAAVFAAALAAWRRGGVHVLTANDYLAKRDADWMGPAYRLLGLTAAAVHEKMTGAERRAAYGADVVYLTAKQCGFDYLSDGLRYAEAERIQRDFTSVIIDEADFILIDEARIPLVIASREEIPRAEPYLVDGAARELERGRDFTVDRHGRNCTLTLAGRRRIEELLGCGGMHEDSSRDVYCAVHAALHARHLLARDVDYIVRAGNIEQVDAFTGRIAERRRWPYGIQTALEAKEGLEIRNEGRILGSITIQDLIGLYPERAALTATAVSASTELSRFYGLSTVIIPPNRPERAVREPDRVFTTREAKHAAILRETAGFHATGRPVLVGTSSVEESEALAARFAADGMPCAVLNAKNDAGEAATIARAGMKGAVTISTNMAGRGTDIRLGGESGEGREEILALGGLYVIGTTRHESVRIDNQLRGRAGRQGDPGSSRFFVSLEDELVKKFAILELIPEKYLEPGPGEEIGDPRPAREIERAQEIIEAEHEVIRRTLRKYTELTEKERLTVRTIREDALSDRTYPEDLLSSCGDRIAALEPAFGLPALEDLLTRVLCASLDSFWADHLALIDEVREGIHLQWLGKEEPVLTFVKLVDTAFVAGVGEAIARAGRRFLELTPENPSGSLPDFETERLTGPSSTWTYLINDDPIPTFRLSLFAGSSSGAAILAGVQAAALLPVLALRAAAGLFRKRKKGKAEKV